MLEYTAENIGDKRTENAGVMEYMMDANKELYDGYFNQIDITEDTVKVRDGSSIAILIYKPKTLAAGPAPVYFYAHGGGAAMGTAKESEPQMAITCVNLNFVVVNVDYKLALKHNCPTGQ